MMKLSDYVIDFVKDLGVKHVFLLPGGGCMHLIDSVGRCKDLEFVCNLHEQACAIAADAYGQYTNNIGVALVTTGPGGTNAITGVAGAWCESTPVLVLSGQVKRDDLIGSRGVRQMGFQEVTIVDLVKPITKYAVTITDPASIRYHMEKAVALARSGRPGPVWIDIPLDVQASSVDEKMMDPFCPEEISGSVKMDLQQQVVEFIKLFNASERPVVLAGNGIRLAKAEKELFEMLEVIGIPVLATWKMLDYFPHEYPYYIGRPGAIAHRAANFAQQNSDLFLSIGARLDFGQTAYTHRNFAKYAHKIIVDVDRTEIQKLDMNIDIRLVADAKDFLLELLRQKKNILKKDRSAWMTKCLDWKNKYPVLLPSYWDEKDGVNNYVLIQTLSEVLGKEDVVVPGSSGACSEVTMQAFNVKPGMRVFNSNGLGAMGFAVPASIGGCIASGKKRTICVDGDGGFQMNIQELETVRRLNLPIKYFILDNDGYGSIRSTQRTYFNGFMVASGPSSGLSFPDLRKIATAYSFTFFEITSPDHIKEKVIEIIETKGPVLCRVKVSPLQYTAPRVSSKQNEEGKMISMPMEDLWPFLDREEFNENMIVRTSEE
jgi:acetolactate synthase-1/2/3 large subunit